MDTNLIGGQIAKFRRTLSMTQEELGRAVGVSTQAVSRWECGGAPDVALLPAIADTLHVTVDALFGREGGAPVDMWETVRLWINTMPEESRMSGLVRLLWESAKQLRVNRLKLSKISYLEKCEMPVEREGEEPLLMRVKLALEQGLMVGVCAEDLAYMSVFPEPAAGYDAFFSGNEAYRLLFSALARPGSLEALLHLYSEKERFYTAEAVAKRIGFPPQEVEEILALLESAHLLAKLELELETGMVNAYKINDTGELVPFLYAARSLMQENQTYHMCWIERGRPWLRCGGSKDKA